MVYTGGPKPDWTKENMSSRDNEGNEIEDGFRRRVRPAGWLEEAIARGEVRDPAILDPDEGRDYSGAVVVRPPIATLSGEVL